MLFSTLGTTLRTAGSKEAQFKIDHGYQYEFARAAAQNKVPVYILVSSYGASESSWVFYSRMKGKLENDIMKLSFSTIHILQPGILDGNRQEKRSAESFTIRTIKFLNRLGLLKSQRPVPAGIVARAMINASFNTKIGRAHV